MSAEAENACRTIDKAEDVLRRCHQFFGRQAEMNAAAHMSERVMYPPIYSAIESALNGIDMFRETYGPAGAEGVRGELC